MIWHHQLPMKGEVTFSPHPNPPPTPTASEDERGNVVQFSTWNKDTLKLSVFCPRADCWHKRSVVVVSYRLHVSELSELDILVWYSRVSGAQLWGNDSEILKLVSAALLCRHYSVTKKMCSFQCSHSFSNKQALCLGCPPCIQYVCLLLQGLCMCL